MGLFDAIRKNAENHGRERVFLGSPEAEAEALPNSQISLLDVYEDYFDLTSKLDNEHFIITGRKGSGKSAFAEYAFLKAQNEPNIFVKFIRQSEFNLEHIVQLGGNKGENIEREKLFEWIILTNLLSLIFSKENDVSNAYNNLKKFIKKNSGYIELGDYQIINLVEEKGFEVNIEYLKRFLATKATRKLQTNKNQAPFYTVLPHLKDALIELLQTDFEKSNSNSYILFFDDLDLIFNAKKGNSFQYLMTLIDKAKELNATFANHDIKCKVILLLRDDIQKSIINNFHDEKSIIPANSAKVFRSYSVNINWYQNTDNNDLQLNIRKFINKRIQIAFDKAKIDYNKNDPWISLVEEPFSGSGVERNHSSFHYVLHHTFFRPRDLILFFAPLSDSNYQYPLSKDNINNLISLFCNNFVDEIKNELSNFYSSNEIHYIFNSLSEIAREINNEENNIEKSISYSRAIEIVKENFIDKKAELVLEDLFNRSLIGCKSTEKSKPFIYFKHRESINSNNYELNSKFNIVLHKSVEIYCQNRGY